MNKSAFLALGLVAGVFAAAPVLASAPLAEYSQVGGDRIIVWSHSAGGSVLSTAPLDAGQTFNTYFTFQNPALSSIVNVDALFSLNGVATDAATLSGDTLTQPGISGSFSFTYEGASPWSSAVTPIWRGRTS